LRIVADDRERESGIPCILDGFPDVELAVSRLPLGDYLVDDKLLFERKTLQDLIHSIKDGRLFSQAARLAASDFQAIIILEGTSSDISGSKMRREAIQGALIHVSVVLGIPLLRSISPQETASLIVGTVRQVNNVANGMVTRHGTSPKGKRRRQLLILQGLPGIGKKRSKLLLEKFETIENVVEATYEELRAIDGIGDNIADEIRHVLSDRREKYVVNR
jgi:ERCC4-type nuclease